MSNTISENQSSNNQNSEDSKQQLNSNDGYTERQLQSAFQPSTVTFVFIYFFLKFIFLF
jgi:hypothetical protein